MSYISIAFGFSFHQQSCKGHHCSWTSDATNIFQATSLHRTLGGPASGHLFPFVFLEETHGLALLGQKISTFLRLLVSILKQSSRKSYQSTVWIDIFFFFKVFFFPSYYKEKLCFSEITGNYSLDIWWLKNYWFRFVCLFVLGVIMVTWLIFRNSPYL